MSAEKIKMMNRSKTLSERISTLNAEKVAAEKEQMDIRHNCEHEIIMRDKLWGFSICIFCGNEGFSDTYLLNNPKVITTSNTNNEHLDKVRKKYKQIWAENDELSEEEIREKLREEFEGK